MKITGRLIEFENVVDGVETRAAVGEVDIGKDEPRFALLDALDRFLARARDAGHGVAEILHHRFDVECNDRLVLDDEHLGRNLLGDLAAGLIQQPLDGLGGRAEDRGDFLEGETLYGPQQERLARQRRNRAKIALGGRRTGRRSVCRLRIGGAPELEKHLIQRLPAGHVAWKRVGIGDKRLQRRDDMRVAARLGPGYEAGKTAKRRQLRRNFSGDRHLRLRLGIYKAAGAERFGKCFIFRIHGNPLGSKSVLNLIRAPPRAQPGSTPDTTL